VRYLCLRKCSFVLLYIVNDAAPFDSSERYIRGTRKAEKYVRTKDMVIRGIHKPR
jgi:hypothetical protein